MFRRATICATVLLVAACAAEGQVYDRSASDIADRLLALDLKADRGAGTYHLTADTVAATRFDDGVTWTIDPPRVSSYTVRARLAPQGEGATHVTVEVAGIEKAVHGNRAAMNMVGGMMGEKIFSWLDQRPFEDGRVTASSVVFIASHSDEVSADLKRQASEARDDYEGEKREPH